jgi:hypothetical protein
MKNVPLDSFRSYKEAKQFAREVMGTEETFRSDLLKFREECKEANYSPFIRALVLPAKPVF